MIQHIFFDLDNTLWNHRKNARLTLTELFEKENINKNFHFTFEAFHEVYFRINENLWEQIRDGKIDKEYLRKHRFYDTFLHFEIDDLELGERFETNFLDEIPKYNELVDGTTDVLDYLQSKNYHLHIISNGFQEVTHRKCELSGIKKYFETITSADELNIRKPNPEIFHHALSKAKAEKKASVIIGDDWITDAQGGASFGIKAIFLDVFNENHSAEGIISIKNLIDIKNLL